MIAFRTEEIGGEKFCKVLLTEINIWREINQYAWNRDMEHAEFYH